MEQKQVQIKIRDDELRGAYANFMRVSHTKEEFVLDFANVVSLTEGGIITARVITSPGHMKRIIKALEENLEKYEKKFGEIEIAKGPAGTEIGFQP